MTPWGTRRVGGGLSFGYSIWNPLSPDGTRAQAEALRQYRVFAEIARVLLNGQPAQVLTDFQERDLLILAAVEQQGSPRGRSAADVLGDVNRAIDWQLSLVANLYDGSDSSAVVVPDTNALLFNIALDDWAFEGIAQFTMILVPTVLRELDQLKILHRNEDVRKKAESLITRIKGYRARGHLTEGVTLRKGVSKLRSVPTEPNMAASLSWLDAGNDDDRLLASFLEVMRQYPHSAVILVTRDINLQNKAELARVRTIEPPETKKEV